MGDHRADHQQDPAGGGHRHQDGCDAECGGQDQARRGEEFEDVEGFDEADTGVLGPSPAMGRGQCLLGHERLADAAGQGYRGQQSGTDPQREVHGVTLLLLGISAPPLRWGSGMETPDG
ncbi:hypothetical protein QF035_007447 [Streptomyces umbrinus]|uniref:Uncharacterized protein n=1 Tax=Streptomyces umbrinus TaxID=67370 RepID=A0ABU0T234_9ACTN|nr:hypothetical protein [Streptomyces umbrinus]